MTNTGIRRKVDDLGRVVIPAGIRRSLSIREGDAVEVHVEGDQVILSKPSDRCVFCGEEEELETFREKALCRGCVAGVGVLDESMRHSRAPEPAAAEPSRHHSSDRDPSDRDRSDLPPWPVGQQGGNGGSRRQDQPSTTPRSRPAPDDRDDRDQDPPASTTAW